MDSFKDEACLVLFEWIMGMGVIQDQRGSNVERDGNSREESRPRKENQDQEMRVKTRKRESQKGISKNLDPKLKTGVRLRWCQKQNGIPRSVIKSLNKRL